MDGIYFISRWRPLTDIHSGSWASKVCAPLAESPCIQFVDSAACCSEGSAGGGEATPSLIMTIVLPSIILESCVGVPFLACVFSDIGA